VQHSQFNFVPGATKTALVALLFLTAFPAVAGTIAKPSKPDPLLDGGPTTPCAAGVDYAAGSDANGAPVVPADVGAPRVPVPDAIAIPLAKNSRQSRTGDSAYVSLDGKKLAPLLNPPPCR
jgi:hypothetical protein